MKQQLWKTVLAVGITTSLVSRAVPETAAPGFVFVVCLALAVLALRTARGLAPSVRLGATFFACAGLTTLMGNLVHAIHTGLRDEVFLVPSFGDLFFPLNYVFLVLGQRELVRRRTSGRDTDAWIDALLIVVSIGVGLWLTTVGGYLGDSGAPVLERVFNGGYLVLALGVFAMTLRVLAAPGVRSMSYYLLFSGVLAVLAIELGTSISLTLGTSPDILLAGLPCIFALLTSALLHPTVELLAARPTDVEPQLRPGRAVLLGAAMIVPQLAVVIGFEDLRRTDVVVLGCATLVLGGLVLARFVRLVRARESMLEDETSLREGGEQMLVASDPDAIHTAVYEVIPKLVRNGHLASGMVADGTEVLSVGAFDTSVVMELLARIPPMENEVSVAFYHEGEEIFFFATVADGTESLVLWVVTSEASRRQQRMAIRSLAREALLALRSVRAAEMRAREESERRWKESIIRSERRFRALVQHSSDIVAVIDLDGNLTYVSPAITKLLGYEPVDVTGQSVLELIHPDDQRAAGLAFETCRAGQLLNRVELRVLDTTGYPHMMEVALADHMETPDVEGLVINARDVTVARELEESLERAAKHDPKTGLLNRSSLDQEIAAAVAEADGKPHEAAVLVVRLEQFELITDGLGFEAVDNILADAADRIRQAVRLVDIVARVDGPQFAVLVRHTYGASETEQLANRVLAALSGSIEYDGQSVPLAANIGIAMSGTQYGDDLLRLGHAALGAGHATGNRIQGFESPMVESVMEQLELRTRLEDAINNDELFLLYQPIVSLDDGLIQGAEALVRWRHPDRGVIGPIHFIPIAEETGLVIPLGEWVLRDVCRQVADWEREGLLAARMTFSLNLSAVQLADPKTPALIADAIATSGVDPTRLVVELTETFFVDSNGDDAVDVLHSIRELGLQVAIDDFGTGYSSLGRIARFPIDIIKIDRAFVSPLDNGDERDLEMLRRIIEIIRGLGVVSVAEGIETGSEAEILRALGCEKGQGYFFDRPMEANRMAQRLSEVSSAATSN